MYKFANKSTKNPIFQWLIFFFFPLVLDRVTKHLVLTGILETRSICPIFNMYFTTNHGIAWGIGNDFGQPWGSLLKFGVIILLGYFAWYMRSVADNPILMRASLLILSGGISNLIDRFWYGSVVDFLQFHYQNYYFPTFNVADVGITLGAALLLYGTYIDTQKS